MTKTIHNDIDIAKKEAFRYKKRAGRLRKKVTELKKEIERLKNENTKQD